MLWHASFSDAAGFPISTSTAAVEANTVCYDYRNPDVVTIVEETTGNPGRGGLENKHSTNDE